MPTLALGSTWPSSSVLGAPLLREGHREHWAAGEGPVTGLLSTPSSSSTSTPLDPLHTQVEGLSQEAEGARAPRVCTASTAEQVSALECSFRHRRSLGPLEHQRLAREMQLSGSAGEGTGRVGG
ncbi:homeobox protein VENTX-like [Mesoplodon densirostris]|uniref:homeobox protein VENTX-like n=1 Tax=Mesoplodon densirostris TaxID=48708 RepID=UPI0028DC59BB|nr:homeobox protein VENTX-like [Mesoplodon densirostris]